MISLQLLAKFENPALIQRSLDYTVSGKVRNQDAPFQLAMALGSDQTRDQAWRYIQTNWDKVHAQLTAASGKFFVGSAGSFCSADTRDAVQSFFSTHKVEASNLALRHALERIDGCIELRKLQESNLNVWLDSQSGP